MIILLTNDDGYGAEGIQLLDDVLSKAGHEVWVCAPEKQRSGFSHSISLKTPVTIKEVCDRHYICQGSPADCIMFFLLGHFPLKRPDVIISGINNGFNIGYDLLYSGTVGSSTEGTLRDIPSIALSAQDGEGVEVPFEDAATFMVNHLEQFVPLINPGSFLNINVPVDSDQRWDLCDVDYVEYYDHILIENPKGTFNFKGAANPDAVLKYSRGSDFDLTAKKNIIAVSPLRVLQPVDEDMKKKLEKLK